MKILEVNKFYAPHIGGIETLVEERARYFASRPDTEVKVLVCQERGDTEEECIDGVEVIRCGCHLIVAACPISFAFLKKFRELAKWADVIECHMPFPLGDLACLLSRTKKRVVLAWHSDVVKQKHLLKLYSPLLRWFLRRADTIIVATKGHIDSSPFLPEHREKCSVIPYPLEIERYEKAKRLPILTGRLHDPTKCKLLFVGRLVYYKGVEVLLEAFRGVVGCELFLCGTGVLEDSLRTQAEGLEVHFMGRLSDEELKAAFADCDIFILPSVENSEAFGIVQQEAMVYGKPVINTSLPTGVPYVSLHGKTGLTVPPRDVQALTNAIQKLADNSKLRRIYGDNAAQRVRKEYDSRVVMQRIYETLKGDLD